MVLFVIMDGTICSAEEAQKRGKEILEKINESAYFRSYGFTDFLTMAYYAFGTHGEEVQRQYRNILGCYMRCPQYIPGLSTGQQYKIYHRVINISRRSALAGQYAHLSDEEFTEQFRKDKNLQNEIWNVMNRETWEEWGTRVLETVIEDSSRLMHMIFR